MVARLRSRHPVGRLLRVANDDPERQVDYLAAPDFNAEFLLTQVVSHYDAGPVARFLDVVARRKVTLPGIAASVPEPTTESGSGYQCAVMA